jgi:opacity protein-like surface antigen
MKREAMGPLSLTRKKLTLEEEQMKTKLVVVATLVALLFSATPAAADITVWLGRLESDDFFIDGTTSIGGALGVNFSEFLAIEIVGDYVPDSELPFELEDLEDLFGIDIKVDMLFVSGNAVLQFPMQGFTPYGTIGYGVFGIRLSSNQFEDLQDSLSGSTFITFGGGAKVDIGDSFALRGEWRYYKLDFDDVESAGTLLSVAENPNFSRLAIGVSLKF